MPYHEWERYLREFSARPTCQRPPPGLYRPASLAAAVDGWEAIDRARLAQFERCGFLVVEGAFGEAEIAAAMAAVGALLRGAIPGYQPGRWGSKHGTLFEGGEDEASAGSGDLDTLLLARGLVGHDERLQALARHPGLQRFLRRAMGDAAVLVHDMVRSKEPGGGDKPWHQDLTHFNVHPSTAVISAWIALDDAPVEAGCLHFVPGTHRAGPARHVYQRDYQIPDDEVDRAAQVAAPVRRGGCVLLHAMVHHGSPPNATAGRRRALQLTFQPAGARTITDRERIMAFSGSGVPGTDG